MKVKISEVYNGRKWEYKMLTIKSKMLKEWELATEWGWKQPLPSVMLNNGEMVIKIRRLKTD